LQPDEKGDDLEEFVRKVAFFNRLTSFATDVQPCSRLGGQLHTGREPSQQSLGDL